ncbi:MAG: immune inhibitor A [Nocardioides sp.]
MPTAATKAKGARGQYVDLEREGTDKIFVVLVEFGDQRYPDPRFTDDPTPPISDPQLPAPSTVRCDNQIPEPDRSVDNSTLWQADFSADHYRDMYFNRMASYYERQSSGRYSVEGDVTEWVKVLLQRGALRRDYCGDIVCSNTKALIRDAPAVWVQDRLDSGMTMDQDHGVPADL